MDQSLLEEDDHERQLQEERNRDLRKITHDVVEVQGLFRDVHDMITQQGDMADNIETNIDTADVNVNKGKDELVIAKKHKQDLRKRCCWLILIILIVVIIIVLIIILQRYLASQS